MSAYLSYVPTFSSISLGGVKPEGCTPTTLRLMAKQNLGACTHVPRFRHSGGGSPCHFGEHPDDVPLDGADVGLDLLQGPRRGVAVEVAGEVDLVADQAHLSVLWVALRRIDSVIGPV